MTQIVLSPCERRALTEYFRPRSTTFIWRALYFKSMSVDARIIRIIALNELGGILKET